MKDWDAKRRREASDTLLQKVGLAPSKYRHRYPSELSGGEQQLIGILRAIITKPELLLMDEPFSALDPISRRQLQDLTKSLKNILRLVVRTSPTGESTHYFFHSQNDKVEVSC